MPETFYDKQIEWPGAAVFALAGWPGFVSVSVPLCVSMCMFMRKGIVVSLLVFRPFPSNSSSYLARRSPAALPFARNGLNVLIQ